MPACHIENTTGLCTLDIMVRMNHELAIANILLPKREKKEG